MGIKITIPVGFLGRLAIVAFICCTKTMKFPFDHNLPKIAVESESNQSIKRYGFSCTCDFQKFGEIGNWKFLEKFNITRRLQQ